MNPKFEGLASERKGRAVRPSVHSVPAQPKDWHIHADALQQQEGQYRSMDKDRKLRLLPFGVRHFLGRIGFRPSDATLTTKSTYDECN